MRIAIIADPIDNQKGGVHVYTRELVSALRRNPGGHEYILVREKFDPEMMDFRQIIIPNIRIGLGLAALRLFFVVPFVLWRNKVDAVFEPAHFGPFNLPRSIKRITMIHDLTPILFPEYHRFHSQLLQRVFLKGILRKADLILTNSQHTLVDLLKYLPEAASKSHAILLAYDPIFNPLPEGELTESDKISEPFFLAVGTIEPRKNLVRLLEAYRIYRTEYGGNNHLIIAGQKGWKSEAFFDALSRHPFKGDIRITGYIPDQTLAAYYTQAKALIYPSEYEGFGLPVLEAMACGCPVICSNTSSLPEVGGEVAVYIDPLDSDDLAFQMHATDQMKPMDYNYWKKICLDRAGLFSWDNYAKDFNHRLNQLF
jgi:glycosyltransferase involved in cell wall biosynthesis